VLVTCIYTLEKVNRMPHDSLTDHAVQHVVPHRPCSTPCCAWQPHRTCNYNILCLMMASQNMQYNTLCLITASRNTRYNMLCIMKASQNMQYNILCLMTASQNILCLTRASWNI
jgi:hypothetical protein